MKMHEKRLWKTISAKLVFGLLLLGFSSSSISANDEAFICFTSNGVLTSSERLPLGTLVRNVSMSSCLPTPRNPNHITLRNNQKAFTENPLPAIQMEVPLPDASSTSGMNREHNFNLVDF